MKKLIYALAFMPILVSAQDKLGENNYKIFSVKANKEIKLDEIITDMATNDVLFFGEEHNDSVDHYLEKTILEKMYKQYGANTTLSMEMFERDVQTTMNEYLTGLVQEKYFKKDARVWGNYRDYRPMVEFAKENKIDVICANAPSRYTNIAGRKGQLALLGLPFESRANFAPVPYDTASGEYHDKLTGIPIHGPAAADTSKNKGKDTAKANPMMMMMGEFNLVMAQSLWDATMAYSIYDYRKIGKANRHKKVFQVNGRFHSDEGFGAAAQLKNYDKKIKTLIISSDCDSTFPNIKWEDYKKNGDYIIITDPKVPKTYDDNPSKPKVENKEVKREVKKEKAKSIIHIRKAKHKKK